MHVRFQLTQIFNKFYSTSLTYTEYFKAYVDHSIIKTNFN
jgi:hypothetical protein